MAVTVEGQGRCHWSGGPAAAGAALGGERVAGGLLVTPLSECGAGESAVAAELHGRESPVAGGGLDPRLRDAQPFGDLGRRHRVVVGHRTHTHSGSRLVRFFELWRPTRSFAMAAGTVPFWISRSDLARPISGRGDVSCSSRTSLEVSIASPKRPYSWPTPSMIEL